MAVQGPSYIWTYDHLDQEESCSCCSEAGTAQFERLMKDFKVHQCALDFDRGFVNLELKHKSMTNNLRRA